MTHASLRVCGALTLGAWRKCYVLCVADRRPRNSASPPVRKNKTAPGSGISLVSKVALKLPNSKVSESCVPAVKPPETADDIVKAATSSPTVGLAGSTNAKGSNENPAPVSYTHLTLPTIYSV